MEPRNRGGGARRRRSDEEAESTPGRSRRPTECAGESGLQNSTWCQCWRRETGTRSCPPLHLPWKKRSKQCPARVSQVTKNIFLLKSLDELFQKGREVVGFPALQELMEKASANTILSHFLGLASSLEVLCSVSIPPSKAALA